MVVARLFGACSRLCAALEHTVLSTRLATRNRRASADEPERESTHNILNLTLRRDVIAEKAEVYFPVGISFLTIVYKSLLLRICR